MGGDKLLVAVHFRIALGADEQHMLEKMRQALMFRRFVIRTSQDGQRCGRFVRVGIFHQQHAQRVVEHQIAVVAIVVGALVDLYASIGGRCLSCFD